MSDVVALLLADYGLDATRGGMLGTLAAHVQARIAQLKLGDDPSLAESRFIERVRTDVAERERLLHAVTVRHSWFYRDPGQLDGLLQRMQARHAEARHRPLDMWIAGCAAGEEAWTIAMLAAERGVALRLHATDVDAIALKLAQLGEYGDWSLRELPERLQRFIEPSSEGRWRITDELRTHDISFVQHNLCDPPLPGPFDVISCRNVLIYFQPARAKAVVDGLRSSLRVDGELLLGAGDLLFRIDDRVRAISAIARPVSKPEPARPKLDAISGPRPRPEPEPSRAEAISGPRPRPEPGPSPAEAISGPRPRPEPEPSPAEIPSPAPSASTRPDGAPSEALRAAGRAVETGDYEVALERLTVILEADPLDAEAHLWTGIAQYGLGREQLAAQALRRARCLAPQLWPASLFAALTHERRGLWSAAQRCWAELERAISASDAPPIEGTSALLDALPGWRAEALALARQRISKHAAGSKPHD